MDKVSFRREPVSAVDRRVKLSVFFRFSFLKIEPSQFPPYHLKYGLRRLMFLAPSTCSTSNAQVGKSVYHLSSDRLAGLD